MDRKRLAAIHIIKKELGLSEAEYRRILKREAGVKSSKDLDEAGFHKLMHYFVRSRRYRVFPGGLTLRQKLFLQYLARSMEWDMEHLQHFIQKYYHKTGIDALTRQEARNAIESLKNARRHWLEKHKHEI